MGNCLTSTKVVAVAQNEQEYDEPQPESIEETKNIITASDMEGTINIMKKKKKKVVRFNLNEESNVDDSGKQRESKNGVVRIRFVVTQSQLKKILSCGEDLKYSSMEELVRVMKLRGTFVSDDGNFHGAWRPALKTIPEESIY